MRDKWRVRSRVNGRVGGDISFVITRPLRPRDLFSFARD